MADTPVPRFDPERLREERHDVDLGEETVEPVRKFDGGDAPGASPPDEPTAGMTPPAR